jgi:UDP-N-acetylglucosamine 1-carboxyvinyltransferase
MKKALKPLGLSIEIEGGKKLSGTIETNTSKNGAMALLAASLINEGATELRDVAKIEEVNRILEVFQSIGIKTVWQGRNLTITPPKKFQLNKINRTSAERTRSVIMMIGALVNRLDKFSLPQSGGCKLGERTVRPHLWALRELGITIAVTENSFDISYKKLHPAEIILGEASDTATINTLLAACAIPKETVIKYASANYQVQELCFFLEQLGVKISGVGTTTLRIIGVPKIKKDISYSISEDPTDSMFFISAAITTNSKLTITRCSIDFLEKELFTLAHMGLHFKTSKPYLAKNNKTKLIDLTILPSKLNAPPEKVHALPYPGLNIDNLPFFAVIATQARGTTLIHDWVYEKRALYYTELDRLGASTVLADPHRFYVTGPTQLSGVELVCPPALRPATILLIGMLSAKGKSILRNIYSINRGYEDLIERVRAIGGEIKLL